MISWLEAKLAEAPESLRARIMEAVASGRGAPEPTGAGAEAPRGGALVEQLRRAGEELMVEARSASPTRDTAMTLLAADALITFACEAVAETAPEKLGEMG